MTHHTFFISDLHLEPAQPAITQLFLRFLAEQAPSGDAVYILGDLFEAWIGDDDLTDYHQNVITALKTLAQRTPVYVMRGNRDFLLGEDFAKLTGCRLLPDPSVIELYGKEVLLMHGDSLCLEDKRHQAFRRYSQNPRYNRYFLMLPLKTRRFIAQKLRGLSQRNTQNLAPYIMDVCAAAVTEQMHQHQTQLLIHGHTHRPAIHPLEIDGKSAYRAVLGAWHEYGSALVYRGDGSYELITIK